MGAPGGVSGRERVCWVCTDSLRRPPSAFRTELESCARGSIPLNAGRLIGNRCQAVGFKYRHLTKCQPFRWATVEFSLLILARELGKSLFDVLVACLTPAAFQAKTSQKLKANYDSENPNLHSELTCTGCTEMKGTLRTTDSSRQPQSPQVIRTEGTVSSPDSEG